MTAPTNAPAARQTRIGRGQVVWFAYPHGLDGDMLRDRRGVGRRFLSHASALKAAQLALVAP
jgi:hypothetical protein